MNFTNTLKSELALIEDSHYTNLCKCIAMVGHGMLTEDKSRHFQFNLIDYDYNKVTNKSLRIDKKCSSTYRVENNFRPIADSQFIHDNNYTVIHNGPIIDKHYAYVHNTFNITMLDYVLHQYLTRLNTMILKELEVVNKLNPGRNISVMFKNIFTPEYYPILKEVAFSTTHYFHSGTASGLIENVPNESYEEKYDMQEKTKEDKRNMLWGILDSDVLSHKCSMIKDLMGKTYLGVDFGTEEPDFTAIYESGIDDDDI